MMSIPKREANSPDTRSVDPNQPFLETMVDGSRAADDAVPVAAPSAGRQKIVHATASGRRHRRMALVPGRR